MALRGSFFDGRFLLQQWEINTTPVTTRLTFCDSVLDDSIRFGFVSPGCGECFV